MQPELNARYEPAQIERKIYDFWETGGFFHAEPNRPGRPYTIVIPPPNVDHAGIATQNVVERELAREGLHRQDLGRERFVERVWQWKEQYGNRIIDQLKRLGCSCDWERERFTMDEGLSRAVLETFVRLHQRGLIYRGKYIVNWCPRCRTALSDIEVEHEEHEGFLWYIRYPLADDGDGHITVATTRPETMLGDTAVAVHPQDRRYAHLVGKTLSLPVLGRRIPVIADEWVDRSFGTGAVKVTPAHDPNDFLLARRHGLPEVVVIDEDGNMTLEAGEQYEGMDRFECREALVEDLRARHELEKIEPHRHSVGHCYRCHTVVEPYLSDQWYVKVKPLAQEAVRAAQDGRVQFHPARWKDFYLSCAPPAKARSSAGTRTSSTPGSPAPSGPSARSDGRTSPRSSAPITPPTRW